MDIDENTDCRYNDDEVFFGRVTLKEVKKRIFMDVHQKYTSLAVSDEKRINDNDLKLIEASSEPNILLHGALDATATQQLKSSSDPLFNRNKQHTQLKITPTIGCESQDSFLEIEKNVTDQCNSPYNCDNNLDNTLEFVDFILNHAQSHTNEKNVQSSSITNVKQETSDNGNSCFKEDEASKGNILSPLSTNNKELSSQEHTNTELKTTSAVKCVKTETLPKFNNIRSEVKGGLITPRSNKKGVSNVFKTPKIPQSDKKDSCAKKTPNRIKTYKHIASPIATYIRNSPQVPLVKDIHPKKPLPSTSLIPKPLNISESKNNKENFALPQLAYRNAKTTLVIDVNKEKLPQSAQKLGILLQKPVVLKHNHRETVKKPLSLQQDSFQDLTLHQADVSVCTEKLAFNKL